MSLFLPTLSCCSLSAELSVIPPGDATVAVFGPSTFADVTDFDDFADLVVRVDFAEVDDLIDFPDLADVLDFAD